MPGKGAALADRVESRNLLFCTSFFAPGGGWVHGGSSVERRRGVAVARRRGPDQPSGATGRLFYGWSLAAAGGAPAFRDAGQRIYGLALGYEDLCDHEPLRSDPLMGLWPWLATTTLEKPIIIVIR